MPNLRLIMTNLHDTGYVTATSEALPAAYTQRSARTRPWRSTDTADQVLTASFDGAKFIDSVVIYRHTLTDKASTRLEYLFQGEVVYDSGSLKTTDTIPLGQFRFGIDKWGASVSGAIPIQQFAFWTPSLAVDGYRITLSDPDNPDGVIEVGRVIAGEAFSPKFNASYDLQLEYQEASEHRRTEGGSLRTVGDDSLARRLPINLDWLEAYDRRRLTDQLLRIGKRGDIYISVFPEAGGMDEAEYAFMARRENNHAHTHNFHANWQSQLTFVEV